MWAWASSSWTIETAEPKLFSAGACSAARRYAGALTSSVSAETVRIRLMPFRYCGRHVLPDPRRASRTRGARGPRPRTSLGQLLHREGGRSHRLPAPPHSYMTLELRPTMYSLLSDEIKHTSGRCCSTPGSPSAASPRDGADPRADGVGADDRRPRVTRGPAPGPPCDRRLLRRRRPGNFDNSMMLAYTGRLCVGDLCRLEIGRGALVSRTTPGRHCAIGLARRSSARRVTPRREGALGREGRSA